MTFDLADVPSDVSLFQFLKSRLDAFLPELEPELYDESQEEFSPWMTYHTMSWG